MLMYVLTQENVFRSKIMSNVMLLAKNKLTDMALLIVRDK